MRLDGPIDDAGPPPALYGGNREDGARIVMVGWGSRGIGSVGQKPKYYTTPGKAAATNKIDEVMDAVRPPPRSGDAGNWLGVTLRRESEGAERLDGILGSGDSGGSAWIRTAGGGWAICGVNANGNGDTYGAQSWFARVSGVRDWLNATMPGLRFVELVIRPGPDAQRKCLLRATANGPLATLGIDSSAGSRILSKPDCCRLPLASIAIWLYDRALNEISREWTMAKVAFLGLGVMGFPMAGHLAAKGHDVTVYNRTFAKAEAWTQKHKGKAAKTPKEAAAGQEIVFSCVGNDEHLRAVVLGDNGAFAGMGRGTIFFDNTTASADIARELHAEGKKRGIDFIDAPVSGGQAGAENGQLTVMCGGEQAPFDKAKPVADAYSKALTLIGPPGSGQITKMMNQMCIAGIVQGLAEALNLGQRSGLDMEKVINAISKGAAQSWQMENRWKAMVEGKFEFGFAVDWMRKDLGISMAEGKRAKAAMPLVALVDQFYDRVQQRGGGRWDTCSLIQPLQKP